MLPASGGTCRLSPNTVRPMEWLGTSLFILIPAYPVVIALACLAWRRRWLSIELTRWVLLCLCGLGLSLWCYDASSDRHLRRSLGFDESLFDVLLGQLA